MEIKGYGHTYRCVPKLWFNEGVDDDKKVVVNLKCAPKAEFEHQQRIEPTFGIEERAVKGREFIGKYVESIEGLEVDGKAVTTFEELFKSGPADLYDWVYFGVLSQKILNEAEIKN